MKLNIPKLTAAVPLTDYAPELVHDDGKAALVWVWINPPASVMNAHAAWRARGQAVIKRLKAIISDAVEVAAVTQEMGEVGAGLHALFAELWSARPDPATHWTVEEVATLAANQENPALYSWLTGRTIAAINDYRAGIRKN